MFDHVVLSHVNVSPNGKFMMQSKVIFRLPDGCHVYFRHSICREFFHGKPGQIPMIKHPQRRRALSVSLVILGGVLIFFAPGNVWIGAVLATLGIVIELIAFGLAHGSNGSNGSNGRK